MHSPVFTSFSEPDLASRARGVAAVPAGALLATVLYYSLYPLLPSVPRWLFEGVRAVLLVGFLSGVLGGLRLAVIHRRDLDHRGLLSLVGAGAAAAACGYLLYGMSVPSL